MPQLREQPTGACFEYYLSHTTDPQALRAVFVHYLKASKALGTGYINALNELQLKCIGMGIDVLSDFSIIEEAGKSEGHSCEQYGKLHYGACMSQIYGDFCRACPVKNPNNHARYLLERSIISRLCNRKYYEEELVLQPAVFTSYVVLNQASILGNKLESPCIVPAAQLIYDCLREQDQALYAKIGQSLSVLENANDLSNALIRRILLNTGWRQSYLSCAEAQKALSVYIYDIFLNAPVASEDSFDSFFLPDFEEEIVAFKDEDLAPEYDEEEVHHKDRMEGSAPLDPASAEGSGSRSDAEGFHPSAYGKCGQVQKEETIRVSSSKNDTAACPERKEPVTANENGNTETLADFAYFDKTVEILKGSWFTPGDQITYIPVSGRRYRIPFTGNSKLENVILHHIIPVGSLKDMVDVSTEDEKAKKELDQLSLKVRKDRCMACEIVYVSGPNSYLLVLWNAATRRYNFIPLIYKSDGILRDIPYPVARILKSDKKKIICYQPYLLLGILGLYDNRIEAKNVHSVYGQHYAMAGRYGIPSVMMEDIFAAYLTALNEKMAERISYYRAKYVKYGYLLTVMPFYEQVMLAQDTYAKTTGMMDLCISRQRKDIMYGYSYLAAGVYPSRQEPLFRLLKNGNLVFDTKITPSISYNPGYIMEFMFMNIEDTDSPHAGSNRKDNAKVRRLLLKELSRNQAAFYHGDLKILYLDDYYFVFYVTHNYRAQYKTVITYILMHETYRYRILANRFRLRFWATSSDLIRYINQY